MTSPCQVKPPPQPSPGIPGEGVVLALVVLAIAAIAPAALAHRLDEYLRHLKAREKEGDHGRG